ncbi:hypothetical protein FQN49_003914 [Arthroderma sp. PD_2]|nr:hypothetical protein FQN49_003914 [Arthroderma sp. PD_2]
MQRAKSSASHPHRRSHHRRAISKEEGEPKLEPELELGQRERERPSSRKEKRVYESSLRSHKSHRRHGDETHLRSPAKQQSSHTAKSDQNGSARIPDAHGNAEADGRSQNGSPPSKRASAKRQRQSHGLGPSHARHLSAEEERTHIPEHPQSDSLGKGSAMKRSHSVNEDKRSRPQTLLLKLFSPSAPLPEKRVTCLTCMSDDIPVSKSAKLACSHRLCHSCLKRIFTLSITDPQHMPPRCCTSDHIPLKHVEKLFHYKFKLKWNKKYREYTTKNRIYCPSRGCGRWITPANIFTDTSSGGTGGRKYGICGRCKTKVCCICNGKWHKDKDCPKDEASIKFAEVAEQEGWQRCFSCSAMVELKEGCNHITCRCTAQFCIVCGSEWKTCDCPWFNYSDTPELPDILGDLGRPATGQADLRQPFHYQEEIDLRRRQEERDEAIARQLQRSLDLDMDSDLRITETIENRFTFGRRAAHTSPPPRAHQPSRQTVGRQQRQAETPLIYTPAVHPEDW